MVNGHLNWFHFHIFEVALLVILIDLSVITRCYKDVYVNKFLSSHS